MKKNNFKILFFVLLFLLFMYFLSIFIFGNNKKTVVNKPFSYVLNEKPRLEDDFYDYINYEYLKNDKLSDDNYVWTIFSNSDKKIKQKKKDIIDNIIKNCNNYSEDSNEKKICNFYYSYKGKNINDIKNYLNKYIEEINNTKNVNDLLDLIYIIDNELTLDILVGVSYNSVPNDINNVYFTFNNISYYGDNLESEIYKNNDQDQISNNISKYFSEILKLYGYKDNKINNMIININDFYKSISRFSIPTDKLKDKGYKLFIKNDLQNELHNININKIVDNSDLLYQNGGKILVNDFNQLKAIDNYINNDNLQNLKDYAIIKIITNYSKYFDTEFNNIEQKYNNIINNTMSSKKDEKDFIYEIIYSYFKDTITSYFINDNLTDYEINFYKKLISEEIEMYKKRIMNEPWLSSKTKENALKKMNNIKYHIYSPEELNYFEKGYIINSKNFLQNIVNMNKVQNRELNIAYKNKNFDAQIDLLEVNAFYSPFNNSINVLIGWIYSFKEAYNLNDKNYSDKYYEILGSTGVVIGHELSHSLDSNGSKYDENGNYINWWNKDDLDNFNKLNNKVIKYYNQYNQFGDTTLEENIADLGGMAIAIDIAEKNCATNDEYKKLFESYAYLWCSQFDPYYSNYLLKFDEHSPNKNRVNAVVSSTDKFYEIYNIKDNDKMYKNKKDRVSVW